MPKQKVDEQIIIIEALKLFRKQSYFNTSMSQIAEACGLQKGSLYHYFPSKEDLMRKVIKNVHEYFKTNVFSHAYDKSEAPHKRLENLFYSAEKVFLNEEVFSIVHVSHRSDSSVVCRRVTRILPKIGGKIAKFGGKVAKISFIYFFII